MVFIFRTNDGFLYTLFLYFIQRQRSMNRKDKDIISKMFVILFLMNISICFRFYSLLPSDRDVRHKSQELGLKGKAKGQSRFAPSAQLTWFIWLIWSLLPSSLWISSMGLLTSPSSQNNDPSAMHRHVWIQLWVLPCTVPTGINKTTRACL